MRKYKEMIAYIVGVGAILFTVAMIIYQVLMKFISQI